MKFNLFLLCKKAQQLVCVTFHASHPKDNFGELSCITLYAVSLQQTESHEVCGILGLWESNSLAKLMQVLNADARI